MLVEMENIFGFVKIIISEVSCSSSPDDCHSAEIDIDSVTTHPNAVDLGLPNIGPQNEADERSHSDENQENKKGQLSDTSDHLHPQLLPGPRSLFL